MNMMASAAAVAASAMPAGGTSEDPAFALIEAHRQAYKRHSEVLGAMNDAQERFFDMHGTKLPDGLSKRMRKELATKVDPRFWDVRLCSHRMIDECQMFRGHPDVVSGLHAELDRQKKAYRAIEDAEDLAADASHREMAALWAIAETKPTTSAGAAAVLRYVVQVSEESGNPDWLFDLREEDRRWTCVLHQTLAAALARLV